MSGKRVIHAPRGSERSCKGWHQEAAMRMLMNNLDPEVAENPDQLVVYGGSLDGKFVLTGGLGGMGGAQPVAATMNGAVFLGVEVDPARIEKRLKSGYCDRIAHSLDEALKLIDEARKDRKPVSVGLVGN